MSLKQLIANSDNIAEMTYNALWQDYLIKWRIEHNKNRPLGDFHASTLADKKFCLVKAVIDEIIKTKDEATSPGTLAIFLNGIDVHNKHQRFLKDTNILVGSEKTYYSEFLDMYATPDAISNFLGRTIIIEYKSMRTELFYSLKEVPYNAFCQSQIYMYMTGIPDAIVVVENKNDQVLKVYTIVFDLRFALNVIRHRLKIIECLREKYIPIDKRLCSKPTKKCKYSEYCFNTKMIKKIEQRIK